MVEKGNILVVVGQDGVVIGEVVRISYKTGDSQASKEAELEVEMRSQARGGQVDIAVSVQESLLAKLTK